MKYENETKRYFSCYLFRLYQPFYVLLHTLRCFMINEIDISDFRFQTAALGNEWGLKETDIQVLLTLSDAFQKEAILCLRLSITRH